MDRLIQNWEPITVFFRKEAENQAAHKKNASNSYASTKVDTILSFMKSPTNHLYCRFLSYTIKIFDGVLESLQCEAPRIHDLLRSLQTLLFTLFSRFLIPNSTVGKSLDEVDFKSAANQKKNEDLIIGEAARDFIAEKEKNKLRDHRLEEFYSNVRRFLVTACQYLLTNLPLNDPALKNAEVADVSLQKSDTIGPDNLRFFINKFPCILPEGATKDTIIEQFCTYQLLDVSVCKKDRMDSTWFEISKVFPHFHQLSMVMLAILTIPHSSAHCERIFSCVRKNRTDQRMSLATETLEALLVLKSRPGGALNSCCNLTDSELDRLKSAHYKNTHHI